MAGKVPKIKVCGSHQHLIGLITSSSEVRHYAYTHRCMQAKKMKTIITTAILFGLCFYLTAYSSGHFVVMTIPILILIGVIATLLISIWIKGEFWQKQIKASICISALV
jgi:hypothetical protein